MSLSYISNVVSIKLRSVYFLRLNSSLSLDCPKGRMFSTIGARSFYAPTAFQQIFRKYHHSAFLRKNLRHIFLIKLTTSNFSWGWSIVYFLY